MKRFLASILTLALVVTALALPAAAAGETAVFTPAVSPGETAQPTAVDTGIPGLTLTVGADAWSLGEAENITSATGLAYPTYLTGKTNPSVDEGKGAYFSFTLDDAVQTGALELTYRLNSGKAFYILDNGEAMPGYDGMKVDVSADLSTTIIVEGGHTYTVYAKGSKLRLYGCAFQDIDPKEVFAQEIAAFPFERIKGANADAAHVDEDLALVDSYESQFGSCDVSWTSSDPAVIDVDGTVNCQKTEAAVTLTGHFSVQERREFAADVALTLTVLADPDDASAVKVAVEALTLGDVSSVKRNLDLPAKGKRGTDITWQSSDEAVVGADGKVYPAANVDQFATLTATVTRGDAKETKTFAVTVAGVVPITLDSWVYADQDGYPRFTPVDGGKLAYVNLTCNEPNPAAGESVFIAVYGPDGAVKGKKEFSVAEAFAGVPTGKSVRLTVDLPMDSGDYAGGVSDTDFVKADDTLAETAKLYVVGDSTASVYGDDRYPRKGWAQMLGGYFDGVEVVDLALSGRSSKSFKNEANYTTLKNSLKKGDYLLIQFGHNDDKADAYADPAPDRFTDGSFQQSMLEYVELAWEKGAHPIIATSISRRKLSDETLEKYVLAAQQLAAELSVPCVDLYGATNGYINQVGVEQAMDMFNCVKPYDSRFIAYPFFSGSEFYEKGSSDDTHLNLYGADLIAQWCADSMKLLELPLAAKLNDRVADAIPSYAEAESVAVPAFADVPAGHWAKAAVDYAAANGIVNGTGEGAFAPDAVTSRAMILTILARLAGEDAAGGESWYECGLAWAVAEGISDGADPEGDITREQMAVMLCRLADPAAAEEAALQDFADASSVSPWAKEGVAWAVENGVISGKPGGLLAPQDPLTRAEAAAILQRFAAL